MSVYWLECPECGGVFTVLADGIGERLFRGEWVFGSNKVFRDREGTVYLEPGTSSLDISCLDCGARPRAGWPPLRDMILTAPTLPSPKK